MPLPKPSAEKQIADLEYEKSQLQRQIDFRTARIATIEDQIAELKKPLPSSLPSAA